jgi:glycine cleavage system H lipoate-binding protein/ABC-type phosphate transport system substrate-binding protein
MKSKLLLLIASVLLSCYLSDSNEVTARQNPSQESSVNVFTIPDLYNLTMKWVSEYGSLNPGLKINVIKLEDNHITEMLKTGGGIGFIDDESWIARNQSSWSMVVGRDIIVPVMNTKNPLRDEIVNKGITAPGLNKLLNGPEKYNWGILTSTKQNIPMHFYIVNDPSLLSGVEKFLNTNNLKNEVIKSGSGDEMISAIQKDPNALGFCKLIQILDVNNQSLAENIQLVPIDKNGNGKIDYMENIYENPQAFSRGVWIGKYPQALSGKIYAVTSEKPKNKAELSFLHWVLTDGQQFLSANGYNDLVLNERQTQLAKIEEPVSNIPSPANQTYGFLKIVLLVLVTIAVIAITGNFIVRTRSKKSTISGAGSLIQPVFDENSVEIPKGVYFDKTHTWVFMKKDGTVKLGIDDFLQHVTGSITRIELKKTGAKIKKGEQLLTIVQKGKQLDIYSPISGTIKLQNESILINPSLLNSAPYEHGWIYTLEPTNWLLEIQFLSMAERYQMGLKNEFSRLKDFLATAIKSDSPEFGLLTLQDGGVLRDNVLADLGPEVWDDFQTKFIDITK